MNLATSLVLAAEEAEHHVGLMDNFGFFIVAFVVFSLLGFVTLSFRHVANRHSHKAEAYAKAHAGDLAPTGHGHH